MTSGATIVQLYTGMVYKGPKIASIINDDLVKILEKDGIKNIREIIGSKNHLDDGSSKFYISNLCQKNAN